jgi:hypothetical protein
VRYCVHGSNTRSREEAISWNECPVLAVSATGG